MSPTYRSFSQLPRPARPERAVKNANRLGCPAIPCSACGRTLLYVDAVQRKLGEGHRGYCHPEGDCQPTDVKRWAAQRAAGGMEVRR